MDALDRKIIGALQQDARVKNADLARKLGVAPSTMLERIRRLEERGFFSGFKAVVNPEKLGFGVQALVSVSLGQHSRRKYNNNHLCKRSTRQNFLLRIINYKGNNYKT